MTRLRRLLTWLLLLALPMQALAAASMPGCGPAGQAQVQAHAQQDAHQHHGDSGAAGHDHHAADASVADADTATPDSGHSCGACAACCHGIGIGATAHSTPVIAPPIASLAEPFAPVHSRPGTVPDKPPRG
jgi:hypothetical protein